MAEANRVDSTDDIWAGKFGDAYTTRNTLTADRLDALTRRWAGVSRTALNKMFLGDFRRDTRILEVGCNIGLQLKLLQRLGFTNLCGIDVNASAIERSVVEKGITSVASGRKMPFENGTFDVVMTSGVLIHIPDDYLSGVMREMHRVTRGLLFCREYYAEKRIAGKYRGRTDLFWRDDYMARFLALFPSLIVEKEWKYPPKGRGVGDRTFLLRKPEYEAPVT